MEHTPTNLAQCLGAGGFLQHLISKPCPNIKDLAKVLAHFDPESTSHSKMVYEHGSWFLFAYGEVRIKNGKWRMFYKEQKREAMVESTIILKISSGVQWDKIQGGLVITITINYSYFWKYWQMAWNFHFNSIKPLQQLNKLANCVSVITFWDNNRWDLEQE